MPSQVPTLSRKEILESDGSFVIIENKVYDVKEFIPHHPGGIVILTHVNGEDATEVFNAFHPPSAYEVLSNYYVGDLAAKDRKNQSSDGFALEIENLRKEMYAKGLFKSSKLFYAYKVLFNYGLLLSAVLLLNNTAFGILSSAVYMAFFWQQSGWLCHDFLHHQVFENRNLNNTIGYFLGNISQGFSVDWWKNKHNSHHASPNIYGLDPDVDTMPILAWSEEAVKNFAKEHPGWLARFMIFNQRNLYFLLLCFARLSWCKSSLDWTIKHNQPVEIGTLLLHWTLYFSFVFSTVPFMSGLLYVFLSQAICGLLLSFCFSLNHNGMPIFPKSSSHEIEFYRKQVLTGRDVYPTWFSTWLTGGLNYQIEHHLFPSLPRHNFPLIRDRVKGICEKYDVEYHVTGFFDGTKEILDRLEFVQGIAVKSDLLKSY